MIVSRLSKNVLERILTGDTDNRFKCVIKFYSNKCKYCHELKDDYTKLAEDFQDSVHFFAYNTHDPENIDNLIKLQGVPTVIFVDVKRKVPDVYFLPEPEKPHEEKWYFADDMRKFIEEHIGD